MSEHIKHVTDASFDSDVLKAGTPVLVDYWAEWCGPCKMIAPILDEVAKDYAGRVTVAKLDVDANPGTPATAHCLSRQPAFPACRRCRRTCRDLIPFSHPI